ncbi:Na+-driven multidrug efflux pump [Alteracholeplasma palmae J233]|uniref:Probable multidrug resistance protein NorM n=1 Tax=Alteracholeplasma palmae (strain ATCC 49389 / J233) TaxID=1318466 RepID=U4KL70_ALTPJ|nr:MATE family efflux transporter [Alteracholeplasma palmae]CCV64639.1 Na+-driven multidrug efflux pump [Alteracholeplasma palmae J233]
MVKLKSGATEKILTSPKMWVNMLIMAFPIFLNNFIKSLNGSVDTFFVSRMGLEAAQARSAMAAMNLHDQVYNVFLAFGVGLAVATMAIVSQYLGANRKDLARNYAAKFITLAVIIGIFFTLLIVSTSSFLTTWLGAKGDTHTYAVQYFNIRSIEYVSILIFLVYQAIRQAQGKTILPATINILGILINILLTWLLAGVFRFGVAGNAIATVIGNMIFVPVMIYDLVKSKKNITIEAKQLALSKDNLKAILPFAAPAALGQAISSLGFVFIQAFILHYYGDIISSSFAVGNRLSNLLLTPVAGLSSVAAVYIGTNIGHKQPERALKSYKTSRMIAFVFSVCAISIVIPLRRYFIYALVSNSDQQMVDIAMEYSLWLLLTQPAMALFQNYMSIFNGSGQSKNSLKMASARLWGLRIPMVLIAHFGLRRVFPNLEYQLIFYAMILSNMLVLIYAEYLRRKIKLDIAVNLQESVTS